MESERKLPGPTTPGGRGRVAPDIAALGCLEAQRLPTTLHAGVLYRWPLSKDLIAEVRITGAPSRPHNLEVLRQYLDLAKNAVQGG